MSLMAYSGLRARASDDMIPEGYRQYARSEGLDPNSFFQLVEQQPNPKSTFKQRPVAGGYGTSWRLLWRFFTTLRHSK